MGPGDLVRGREDLGMGTSLSGVIIRESERTNVWGEEVHRWWWILCGGKLVEEIESRMELVE